MEPGRVLGGRYRLRVQVGSGRYGRVWRAHDEVGREVTVEELGEVGTPETARVARALRETPALLGHRYVAPVEDVVEADGVLWAVIPVLHAPSLADLLAEHGPLPRAQVRDVARAALDALDAMHAAGITHGDVQPASIRSDHGRWLLVPRIGTLAREDTQSTWHDADSEADYIAPELLHGARRTPSSDLYSLGATLYHLVFGHAPFHRDSVIATLSAVAREEPPPLDGIGGLGRLIEGLLNKNPERRLTAAEARQMLGDAENEPPRRSPDRMAGPAPSAARRGPVNYPVGMAGWALAVLLAVALASARAMVSGADLVDFLATVLPWAIFVLGICVLAVQARAALARRSAPDVPVWQWYVRSLAPPAPWTDEERDRRRAAAERSVEHALLTADRRVAAASPDRGRGTTDV
ncbi:serine/threonine-protein kinase [Streptomyces lucensis]|nr:serine/threonine-protein kinase [Streptomyces lucensis]